MTISLGRGNLGAKLCQYKVQKVLQVQRTLFQRKFWTDDHVLIESGGMRATDGDEIRRTHAIPHLFSPKFGVYRSGVPLHYDGYQDTSSVHVV